MKTTFIYERCDESNIVEMEKKKGQEMQQGGSFEFPSLKNHTVYTRGVVNSTL